MDIQLKRGLLDVCVLAVLQRGDSYGYKIVKDVSECIDISESTLYPILKRLEGSGCLVVRSVEHNGRLRKYYQITQDGTEKITDFLDNWKTMTQIHEFIRSSLEPSFHEENNAAENNMAENDAEQVENLENLENLENSFVDGHMDESVFSTPNFELVNAESIKSKEIRSENTKSGSEV